jgi:indolepyruvate ferredoxin oxidoreductase beta subunit
MSEITRNILICGVGGQGSLLASKIIGNAVLLQGYDVKVSEVHGMSQRGGSVVTYVKYGEKVYSPIICRGEADVILAFEQLEAARWLPYLKAEGGLIVVNTQKINPMPVVTGAAEYPADIVGKIKRSGTNIIAADALNLAKQAGNERAVNVALIGIMTAYAGYDADIFREALKISVPPKFYEANLKAFELGNQYIMEG